jgi:hypothetical protein
MRGSSCGIVLKKYLFFLLYLSKGAFPPSHFSYKLDDKLAHKVTLQTNVTHFCLVGQSEVCYKPNWFATNSLRQRCEQVCHQICCKNVMVEKHLNSLKTLKQKIIS